MGSNFAQMLVHSGNGKMHQVQNLHTAASLYPCHASLTMMISCSEVHCSTDNNLSYLIHIPRRFRCPIYLLALDNVWRIQTFKNTSLILKRLHSSPRLCRFDDKKRSCQLVHR